MRGKGRGRVDGEGDRTFFHFVTTFLKALLNVKQILSV